MPDGLFPEFQAWLFLFLLALKDSLLLCGFVPVLSSSTLPDVAYALSQVPEDADSWHTPAHNAYDDTFGSGFQQKK